MIVVIVHHWCKPDALEAALKRVDDNGDSSASALGFLFRYRLHHPTEPLRLSTVSAWTSRETYKAWDNEKRERDRANNVVSPYERVVNELFEVGRVHGELPDALMVLQ
jgi:heme-degrading monooxygenase HmoA